MATKFKLHDKVEMTRFMQPNLAPADRTPYNVIDVAIQGRRNPIRYLIAQYTGSVLDRSGWVDEDVIKPFSGGL